MAGQYRVAVDDVDDADIREAAIQGRLEVVTRAGGVHCPHCGKCVGVLVRGTPSRRKAAARSLLALDPKKLVGRAVKPGHLESVAKKAR